jgi:hypothetical protein
LIEEKVLVSEIKKYFFREDAQSLTEAFFAVGEYSLIGLSMIKTGVKNVAQIRIG